ncbi:vesicle-associated membrane protein-associated protein A [Drosophila serrata]|uniref:vesicle-associated membrane protein-associated protein A n=1 Tax=Drosophila serrata TaxID=7274 RepID=UPI000A1D1BFA|nr:vesicle-associated membrane protein-associated protein A [Drosophila serrata]KAH8363841.1 hypothetical protein KR200_010540 [Drosophila serrata]
MSSNKTQAMLTLEPRETLVFEGPFNRSVCKNLVLGNPSKKQKVIFKLKTTSPRMFLVRPNIGFVGPNEKVTVDVFMQPIAPDAGQKQHKFLIQAAFVADGDIDTQEFWTKQKQSDIWEAKIKCLLVKRKQLDETGIMRQAGGATNTSNPKPDGEIEFDAEEVSEPVAQLIKQVSMLEEERSFLKTEVSTLRDQVEKRRAKHSGMNFFLFASCIFTIISAIIGAYYGKLYL